MTAIAAPSSEEIPQAGAWAEAVMEPIYAEGDRFSRYFILLHFLVGLGLAPFYDTWVMALTVGPLAAALFLGTAWLAPGTLLTRCVAGVALQAFVALHIYQLHGLPEMHFFFFSAFTMLIAYQDWRAPWPGALLIIGQHIWFAYLENSGIEMYFFPGEVSFWQLFFHFGIAILHVAVCSHWAMRLRRNTLHEAWNQRRLDIALQRAETGMATRSSFLATMSHEIRTPMNGVLGMLTLLEQTPITSEQQEYLGIARRSGEGLLGVINDVLDFSKLDAGRMTSEAVPFNPRDLLDEIRDLFLSQARKKSLEFTCSVPADMPTTLVGDDARLRQILLNLVGNAMKFTSQGHVRVAAGLTVGEAAACDLRVTVADTGIGMSPATIAALFSEFTQADAGTTRRFGGTGLGLAISQRLAGLLGGEIAVSSELGRGTTFTLRVPVAIGEAPAEGGQPAGAQSMLSTDEDTVRLRVLLVEDHPVNQLVATRLLQRAGCVVAVAGDGMEALAHLEQSTFDLVLMDCHMPVMDGFEATERIRASESPAHRVAIVALTASVMEEDRRRCFTSGMDDVLAKPIVPAALANVLQSHRARVARTHSAA